MLHHETLPGVQLFPLEGAVVSMDRLAAESLPNTPPVRFLGPGGQTGAGEISWVKDGQGLIKGFNNYLYYFGDSLLL